MVIPIIRTLTTYTNQKQHMNGDYDALDFYATVCSTWISMSQGTCARSPSRPYGFETHGCVYLANKMVARVALLMCLGYVFNKAWILEQPSSSLMQFHPALLWIQHVCDTVDLPEHFSCVKVDTYMGAFGHSRQKQTWLLSNKAWCYLLERASPPGSCFPRARDAGIVQVCSKGGWTAGLALKATQAYTREFAQAVFEVWDAFEHKHIRQVTTTNKNK